MTTTTTFPRGAQVAFLIIFFLAGKALYCQTLPGSTDYDYAAFRFPDIDRKALDAQFNLLGNALQTMRRELGFDDNSSSNLSNNLNLAYSRFRNTARLQSQQSFNFNQAFSTGRGPDERYNRIRAGFGVNRVHREYYKPLRFTEYNLFLQAAYEKSTQQGTNPFFQFKNWNVAVSASLPLKIGKGRIEPIDDVFIAKFLMDDLLENSILAAPLSQENLFSLGQVMAAARNQRIFDFRRQRIYELTQLDNWFKKNGLEDGQSDIVYFSALADNWLYAFRNVRQAGKRVAVGVEPFVLFSHSRTFAPGVSSGYFGARVFGEYLKERPVNQFWQAGKTLRAGLEYLNNPVDWDDKVNNIWIRPYAEFGANWGYFPNSRTALLANAVLRYEYYWADPDNLILFDFHVIQPAINFSTTYFINYQFRIEGSLNGSYTWASDNARASFATASILPFSAERNSSRFLLSGNIALLYSFF
ncbi:MAG: hypothetical protein HUU01_02165 [Saprospiraceae bacterium]|nr:hypothetical protein [Saprospiraceae bacterium]